MSQKTQHFGDKLLLVLSLLSPHSLLPNFPVSSTLLPHTSFVFRLRRHDANSRLRLRRAPTVWPISKYPFCMDGKISHLVMFTCLCMYVTIKFILFSSSYKCLCVCVSLSLSYLSNCVSSSLSSSRLLALSCLSLLIVNWAELLPFSLYPRVLGKLNMIRFVTAQYAS